MFKNDDDFDWNNDYLNIMSIISFVLGLKNLDLNIKQTSNDEIMEQARNNAEKLEKQNDEYLKTIINQNNEILKLLKGGKYEN